MAYKKISVLTILMLLSVVVYAECAGVMCGDVKVQSMQVDAGGTVWIQTTGTEANLDCTPNSGIFIKLDGSASGGKNVYSGLLAYKLADKALNIRVIDNSNPCELAYIVTK